MGISLECNLNRVFDAVEALSSSHSIVVVIEPVGLPCLR